MHLYQEILAKVLQHQRIHVSFPDLEISGAELVELKSYWALKKIKKIVENDDLNDFMCIEEIVRVLEEVGSDGVDRHDF